MTATYYASVANWYSSALFRALRVFVFFMTLYLLGDHMSNHAHIGLPLFFFLWFCMIEIFIRYRIYTYHPTIPLRKVDEKNVLNAATLSLLRVYIARTDMQQCLSRLYRLAQVTFLLEKIGLGIADIPYVPLEKQQVLVQCKDILSIVRGEYITSMDFFMSYLLLSEPTTKLLFAHHITQEDALQILVWARSEFSQEERPIPKRMKFSGEGIGESLVSGWTLETQKYTANFTYAVANILPFLAGREVSYKLLLEALSKPEMNNVMLVGETGVGKENLVAKLTDDSYFGLLSPKLNYKKVLELMVGPLIAGAQSRSELEERLQSIIQEVSHSQNVIVYIPDFQNLMGSSSYGIDVSGALLPYLQSGALAIIASMTQGNYKTYLSQNPLKDVFTVLTIDEPDIKHALAMLLAKSVVIEQMNHVTLTYQAIVQAVTLADRYDQDDVLPGSAITLLNDTANSVALDKRTRVEAADVERQINKKTHVNVGAPNAQEKDILLHLEDKMHERIIDQVRAISAIGEALRRRRSGLTMPIRPISFLFLGPTGVGKSETAKALAAVYFGGEQNMIRLDMSEYADIDGERRLLGSPPGEGSEQGEITDKIHDHPFSLVLLDEFEKASPRILDLFLQVLDDGRLTDNKGRTVTFVNSIIIATSNAGAEFIREKVVAGIPIDKVFQQQLLEYLQQNQLFKPELLNRFDDVVVFEPLGDSELMQIVQLLLHSIARQLKEQDITLMFDDAVLQKIVKEGADAEFGARPLRRYIQDNVEDLIAQKKLKDEIKRGSSVLMTLDSSQAIVATVSM